MLDSGNVHSHISLIWVESVALMNLDSWSLLMLLYPEMVDDLKKKKRRWLQSNESFEEKDSFADFHF